MDPRQFKNSEDLAYAYKTAWAWAQVAEDIFAFTEKMMEESQALTDKETKETIDPLREAVS